MERAILTLFALLCCLTEAKSQQTLTVYKDGTETSTLVPICGSEVNSSQECEFVIPQDKLSAMKDQYISKLTFHLSSPASDSWGDARFQVFLKEVDNTTISKLLGTASATVVYEGPLDGTQSTMDVEFNNDYNYGGGNLLVGVYQVVKGDNSAAEFYGEKVEGACVRSSDNSILGNVIFIPRTTFTYNSCAMPDNLSVGSVNDRSATLTWSVGSGEYNVEYKKSSDAEWTTAVNGLTRLRSWKLKNLAAGTAYQARVQCVSGSGNSGWKTVSFFTDCGGAITSFPWSEDFEGYTSGTFNHPCWVNEHIEGTGSSLFKINTSSKGSNSTRQLYLPDQAAGTMTKLVLPAMTLPTANYVFSLDVYRTHNYTDQFTEGIRVFASANGEIDGATELAFIPREYGTGNDIIASESTAGWYTYELPIPMDGTCYIILRGESKFGAATYMDNFMVKDASDCDVITSFPWSENFENYAQGNFTHPCWVNKHLEGDGTAVFRIATSAIGDNDTHHLFLLDQAAGTMTKLMLPAMSLPSDNYIFSLDVYRTSSFGNQTTEGIRVFASADGQIDGATELAFIPRYCYVESGVIPAESTQAWFTYELPIPMSGTCYIILRGESQNGDIICIDNFVVKKSGPCPINLMASDITDTKAELSWTPQGSERWWVIYYKKATESKYTPISRVSKTQFTLENLSPETTYNWYVRPAYSQDNIGQPSAISTFTTTPVPEAVAATGWRDDFEGTSCGWRLINGRLPNAWSWGTATSKDGTHALYISDDGGETNAYSNCDNTVYAAKFLSFTGGKYTFSYNWKANGEEDFDYLRVALVPSTETLTATFASPDDFSFETLPSGWIALDGGSQLCQASTWQSKNVTVDVGEGNYYLVFVWNNDDSGVNNPPAAIDNVRITPLIMGDVNASGSVTPADAIMILYHYFGVEQTDFILEAANVNGDGGITPADAIEALYIYFGSNGSGGNSRQTAPATGSEPE